MASEQSQLTAIPFNPKIEQFILWKSPSYDTWEPISNLQKAKELIEEYENGIKSSKNLASW